MTLVKSIWADERGQDLIEYALMAGFIAVAAASTMPSVRDAIKTVLTNVKTQLDTAK